MKHILAVAALTFLSANQVLAADKTQDKLPFEPAYASEQPEIGFEALEQEAEQFEQLANWKDLRAQLMVKRHHAKHLMASLERGRVIVVSEGISRIELSKREHDFNLNDAQIQELEHKIMQAELLGQIAQLGVKQQGGNGDHRIEIVKKRIGAVQHQIRALQFAHRGAEISQAYYQERLDELNRLRTGKHVGLIEWEEIHDQFEEAESRSISSTGQIKVLERAVQGLQNSLEKLTQAEKP